MKKVYVFLIGTLLLSACAMPEPVYVRSINHNVAVVEGKSYLIETPILASEGRGTFVGQSKFYDVKEKITEQETHSAQAVAITESATPLYDQAESECLRKVRTKGGPNLTRKETQAFLLCLREKLAKE